MINTDLLTAKSLNRVLIFEVAPRKVGLTLLGSAPLLDSPFWRMGKKPCFLLS